MDLNDLRQQVKQYNNEQLRVIRTQKVTEGSLYMTGAVWDEFYANSSDTKNPDLFKIQADQGFMAAKESFRWVLAVDEELKNRNQ